MHLNGYIMYVDESLCTGCGLCLDACKQGALSLRGNTAMVDAELCTSCNRCAAVCITGALRSAEIVSAGSAFTAPDRSPHTPVVWSGTPTLSAVPREGQQPLVPRSSAAPGPSKLASAEKILAALIGFATLMIERRDRSADQARGCTGSTTAPRSLQVGRSGRDGSGRGRRGRRRRLRDNRCHAARGGMGT